MAAAVNRRPSSIGAISRMLILLDFAQFIYAMIIFEGDPHQLAVDALTTILGTHKNIFFPTILMFVMFTGLIVKDRGKVTDGMKSAYSFFIVKGVTFFQTEQTIVVQCIQKSNIVSVVMTT